MKNVFLIFSIALFFIACKSTETENYAAIQNQINESFPHISIDEQGFLMYDCESPDDDCYKFDLRDVRFTMNIEEEGSKFAYCLDGPCPETIYIWFRCHDGPCMGNEPYDEKWYNYSGVLAFEDIGYGKSLYEFLMDAQQYFLYN